MFQTFTPTRQSGCDFSCSFRSSPQGRRCFRKGTPYNSCYSLWWCWKEKQFPRGQSFTKMKASSFLWALGCKLSPSSVARPWEEQGFSLGWDSSGTMSPEYIPLHLSMGPWVRALLHSATKVFLHLTCFYLVWTKVTQTIQVLLSSFPLLGSKPPRI